jgi:hypothetical protein
MTRPDISSEPASPTAAAQADERDGGIVRERSRIAWYATAALLMLAAAAVRIWAAQGDFWLDEVWSYARARTIDSPLAVFSEMPHDNNHHLITLWFYLLGPQQSWIVLRLPSLVAGIGSVALASWVARQWGAVDMWAAALLTAGSYVLIIYSSEARGYALAGFFCLAGLVTLQRYLATRGWLSLVSFWLASALGFLSHLTVLHFYFGVAIWSAVRFGRTSKSSRQVLQSVAICHAVPAAFLLFFYFFSIRGMTIGGTSNREELTVVLARTLALSVGCPAESFVAQLLVGLLALCAGILALWVMRRENSDLWIFFAVTVFASPLVSLLAQTSAGLFVRYFYINILFYLLLLSYLFGRLWRRGYHGRALCAAGLACVLIGNVLCLRDFAHGRRGQYRAALWYMAEHSPGRVFEVATDQRRNVLMLAYYTAYLPADKQLNYYGPETPASSAPEWFVTVYGELGKPRQTTVSMAGTSYSLAEIFRHAGLSGFDWAVYRRVDRDARPDQPKRD